MERIGWAGPREGNRAGNVRSRRPVPPARRDVLQAESLKGDGTLGSNKNKKWGKATIAGLVAAATLASPVVGAFAADGGGGSGDGTGTGDARM